MYIAAFVVHLIMNGTGPNYANMKERTQVIVNGKINERVMVIHTVIDSIVTLGRIIKL